MKFDDKINGVASAVMSQMLSDERITTNMTEPLLNKIKGIGIGLVVAVLGFSSTGMAHADTMSRIFNTTVGIGVLSGVANSGKVPDGTPLDCAVSGKSAIPVALGTALGAYAGKHVGGGTGKKIAIVAGGLLGGVSANAIQDANIRGECMEQNAAYQNRVLETSMKSSSNRVKKVSAQEVYENTPSAQYNRNGSFDIADSITGNTPNAAHPAVVGAAPIVYRNAKGEVFQAGNQPMVVPQQERVVANNNHNVESGYPFDAQEVPNVRYPTRVVANVPQNTVLYAFQKGRNGPITYVTGKDSPGVASMVNNLGNQDISSHPRLQTKMDSLNNQMIQSFAGLESASNDYLVSSRGVRVDNLSRLDRDLNRRYVKERVENVERAMTQFSEARGEFMQLADVAALEGYKLDRYAQAVQFLDDGPLVNRLYQKKNVARFTKFTR